VEGGTITGLSDGFQVHANLLHHLEVSAAPELITAGTGVLNISVIAVDSWSNRVTTAVGEIGLSDETGPLRPEDGNGTQSCGSLYEGVGVCTATLFQGGLDRTITVSAAAGAVGTSNPITVLSGPVDNVELDAGITTVQAGTPFDTTMRLLDEFNNPIELSEAELDGVVFYDEYGPIECLLSALDTETVTYAYGCVCTVAGEDNVLHVVLDILATTGASSSFTVTPGPLKQVEVNLSAEDVGESIEAGSSLTAGLIGFDAYGNAVSDELSIELSDTASGMSPRSVSLVDGHATLSLVFSKALDGNTVTVSSAEEFLGISVPFEVRAGPAIGLRVETKTPWVWTGEATQVRVYPVDAYGNLVADVSDEVTLQSVSGLGPDVSAAVDGDTTISFIFEAAGLNDVVEVSGLLLSGSSDAFDVVTDCLEGPSVTLVVVGASYDSLCLGEEDRVTATLGASPGDLLMTHFLAGLLAYRTTGTSIEHTFEGAGRTEVQLLGIRSDGCAERAAQVVYHGPVGPPVGEVEVSVADGTLIAGTTGGDERTRVNLFARTCTGDLADGGELLVRANLGQLESTSGTALTTTGRGLQLELDSAGEGSIRWTMADVTQGGGPELYAGGWSGAGFGQASATVSGDDVPPQVIETVPMGSSGGIFSEIQLIFTEPMLTSLGEATLMDSVELTDPDGLLVDWVATAWSSDGMVLTLYMDAPREASTGLWELWVYDELRDSAGNRLDGDLDGDHGGALSIQFGNVLDEAPAVVYCQPSTSTIRPDGDDGEGLEAEGITMSIGTDDAAAWWRMEVFGEHGDLVLHRRTVPAGTETGAVLWDGRDQGGEVVANGLYRLEVGPTDMHWNLGEGCTMAVRVDNHLSPLSDR
jgi:hypothetical protein